MFFVTGGTGFLGRHLIPALCREGHQVRVLSRHPDSNTWLQRYPSVEVVQGDLGDAARIATLIQGCRYVIHAGGLFRFWGDEQNFMRTNAEGTENVMAAASQAGIERVVHISSIAVIGHPDPANVIDETHPPQPADAYQRSKLEGEQIALRYCRDHQLPVIILRPGAFYGPFGEYAFNRLFFRDPMRGVIMQIDGGRYIIFPAYIADVVQGIFKALDRGISGEVYNICGDWISHKEAFDIICREARLPWPRARIPGWLGIATSRFLEAASQLTRQEPFWPINLRSYVYNSWRVSSEKARQELGFVPTTFLEGARRTIAWYRAGKPEDIPETQCT
ncbi:MAG: NAD-dependent epimerase/dehydratase family protein [bacterium]|nr:NAD-dependent epimerase/dehydratase family protein [bacterium]